VSLLRQSGVWDDFLLVPQNWRIPVYSSIFISIAHRTTDMPHSATSPLPSALLPPIPVLTRQSWDCERELTLAEKLAFEKTQCKEAMERPAANFSKLCFVLEEGDLLEVSTKRIRPQRVPTGITKLQSSYLLRSAAWNQPVAHASIAERIKVAAVKAKESTKKATSLPPPLTHVALNEAYMQLTPGAEQSIKSAIEWWRTNKLSDDDVLATVNSFHGSSAALRMIFQHHALEGEVGIEGEVASEEEICELSRLMCA